MLKVFLEIANGALAFSVAAFLLFVSADSASCLAQESTSQEVVEDTPELREELAEFQPFIGTWEIDGKWLSGDPIWARTTYSIGMAGNFVESKTYTRDPDGKVYQRYVTIWRWDEENQKVTSHGFTYDGSYTALDPEVTEQDGKSTISSVWEQGGATIKQTVQINDESSYSWKVYTVNGDDETPLMDGVWRRK